MSQRPVLVSWLVVFALAPAACVESDDEGRVSEPSLRSSDDLSRIREIEDHRLIHDPFLGEALDSRSARVVAAALIAIGRIGDTTYSDRVADLLDARDAEVRREAAFAAGLLGGDALRDAVEARIAVERDDLAVARLCRAIGLMGDSGSLASLLPLLDRRLDGDVQAAAVEAIGALGRRQRDLDFDAPTIARMVELADGRDDHRAEAAAFALFNIPGPGTQYPEAAVLDALRGARPATREHLLRVLGRIGSPASVQALAAELAHAPMPTLRARAAAALAIVDLTAHPDVAGAVIEALARATRDPSRQVVVAAARALGAKGPAAEPAFDRLLARFESTSSSWVRAQALPALVAIDPAAARPLVDASLDARAIALREAAVFALGDYATDADLATLAELAADDTPRIAAAAINVLAGLPAERVPAEAKEAARAWITTRDVNLFFAVVTAAANLGWTDFLAPVSATYPTWTGPVGMDGRLGVLTLIQAVGSQADLPIVEQALDDTERNVVVFAAEVHLTLTGVDVSDRIPLASRITTDTPGDREIERALRKIVRVRTERGSIWLRMRREAPLTVTNFVRLVEDGFYDGIEFHRIEPAFVIQGGDPTGSGFEGGGDLIREEISSLEHHRGTVGIATAGKDTGSSQFFVNHTSNLHLNGRFTIFADVVAGMDVVDRIEVGDEILSASAF